MNKRLYEVRKSLEMTQKSMADVLGIGQNAYSMIENGKIGLTARNRDILEEKLNINSEYLLNGTLPMLIKRGQWTTKTTENTTTEEHKTKGVPFISKTINSTQTQLYTLDKIEAEYYIDFKPFNDCSFYRPVIGESMSPRYNPSDLVACKSINSKNNIMYGES